MLIEKLAELIIESAKTAQSRAAKERNDFRAALLDDLRRYSVLIEQVRIRFLAIHDALRAERPIPSGRFDDLATSLEEESLQTEVLILPEEIARAVANCAGPSTAELGNDALERTQLAMERLNALDDAWSLIRPRLDEALEGEAVAYLRTYRHEFRRLAQRAIWIVDHYRQPEGPEIRLVRNYVEAVLLAADQWNSHVVGTIGEIRRGRAI
jgi:hypothetical protein